MAEPEIRNILEFDSHKFPNRTNPTVNIVAGYVGGFFDVFVRQPFDTVKVRMQSMPLAMLGEEKPFRNSLDCFHKTLTREGIRGLYRGMSIVLMTDVPLYSVYFLGASIANRLQKSDDHMRNSVLQHFIAGCLGGALTSGIATPMERIKILLQVEQRQYFGPVHIGRQLWQTGGLRTFYRGISATLCRDIPGGGMYLAVYEWVRRYLSSFNSKSNKSSFNVLPTIIAGGVAGLAVSAISMPPDVVKSRLQSAPDGKYPHGMRSVFKELILNESLASFYRGFVPIALYAFPGSAACMLGFELIIHFWPHESL